METFRLPLSLRTVLKFEAGSLKTISGVSTAGANGIPVAFNCLPHRAPIQRRRLYRPLHRVWNLGTFITSKIHGAETFVSPFCLLNRTKFSSSFCCDNFPRACATQVFFLRDVDFHLSKLFIQRCPRWRHRFPRVVMINLHPRRVKASLHGRVNPPARTWINVFECGKCG